MKLKDFEKKVNEIYEKVINHYGESKHHKRPPYINIDTETSEIRGTIVIGEYIDFFNGINLFKKNINSLESLARVIVHEYQHYLQSPLWMKRYYKMGYTYDTHPYELAAYKEEENWKQFV